MGNYVRTGPFTNGAAPGISAAFLNNLENVLEQPTGGSESGRYLVAGWSGASGDTISNYITTLSRTSVPLSVTFDEADATHPGSLNAPAIGHLTWGGFQMFAISNAAGGNLFWGGNYTVNY